MRRAPGERVGTIRLPAMDGTAFDSDNFKDRRFMLSFFRFAACPFCNLRVHELVKRFDELGNRFTIIAIFDSSPENLRRYAERHAAPFPILADERNVYYRAFGIERSVVGVLRGMVMRLPAVLNAMFVKGYLPTAIKGHLTTMPADFLVDEAGVIRLAYYGRDEGDHLPFDRVRAFALGAQT